MNNLNKIAVRIASTALLCGSATAWAACNPDSSETGAASVIDLQGQGNFTCAQIAGSQDNCLNANCTMEPVPGFQYQVNSVGGGRKVVTWKADEQVDKIYVTASGNGSRCLYDFEPGGFSDTLDVNSPPPGSFLEPAGNLNQTTVVACWDGFNAEIPEPPRAPIATVSNCAAALPGVQSAIDADPNVITAVIIGTDEGLNGQGEGDATTVGDGDYVLGVCANDGQEQCVNECLPPTETVYACDPLTLAPGELCLAERACATSDEKPTGSPSASQYCWELSHDVMVGPETKNSFVPPTEKQSGNAAWEQYDGSTCVLVYGSYRGVPYAYWAPRGCR